MDGLTPYLAYVLALGVAAAIPGPGVAAVMGRALGSGGGSLAFILGLALGDVLFLTVAVLGLAALAASASGAFLAVKVAGGLYLLHLAWRFWTAEPEAAVVRARSGGRMAAALGGLAVTLGNPKTVVFYLALVPNVLDLSAVGLVDWLVLSALTVAVLMAVLTPYAALAGRLRALLTRPAALRRLNRGAAVLIGGAGALILREAAVGEGG